jgi:hypothetical protein
MMNIKPKLIVRGYSLPEQQVEMVKQEGVDRKLYNDSAALRQILDEWAEMKKSQQTNQQPVSTAG